MGIMAGLGGGVGGSMGAGVGGVAAAGFHHSRAPAAALAIRQLPSSILAPSSAFLPAICAFAFIPRPGPAPRGAGTAPSPLPLPEICASKRDFPGKSSQIQINQGTFNLPIPNGRRARCGNARSPTDGNGCRSYRPEMFCGGIPRPALADSLQPGL